MPAKIDWQATYQQMISDAADLWMSTASRRAMSGLYDPLYLYMKPSTPTKYGELFWLTAQEQGKAGWELVTAEGFGPHLNRQQVRNKIADLTRRCPLIPWHGV